MYVCTRATSRRVKNAEAFLIRVKREREKKWEATRMYTGFSTKANPNATDFYSIRRAKYEAASRKVFYVPTYG